VSARFFPFFFMSQSPTLSPSESKWPAVEEAARTICNGQGNFSTLGQLIQGLFDLGLAGLVEPVIAAIDSQNAQWHTERDSILQRARQFSGSSISWDSRAHIFSKNIAALSGQNSSLG
jgi:hypothetical protein